jgi:thymidylate synthase ThyX
MAHSAKIIADSISPDGVHLTTLEVTFPRIVLAEFNTHRMFSRNSASSRAIPVEKMIRMVYENPYVPTHWGKNQKGMQAEEEIDEAGQRRATKDWLRARDHAVDQARELLDRGVHKQITNRLLEPFMWHTCIVTATEWDNFFHLRRHPAAHPEIKLAADRMFEAMAASEPKPVDYDDWHMPFIDHDEAFDVEVGADAEYEWRGENTRKVSVGRCARVSYLTHDGKRDPAEDIRLHDQLLSSGHMSPFEHVARPMKPEGDEALQGGLAGGSLEGCGPYEPMRMSYWCGNFRGWVQYRKLIPNERDILGAR